jgi:hypothetical protein
VNTRLLVLLFCLFMPLSSASADDWKFSNVNRIVALSDVHGAYDALIETLQEASVINDNLSWSGAETHLVITGDLLDRGADSRKVMDLMIRLERESALAGGQVHQLLGNHEVMNLIGDLRYVADGEYAAFSDDESLQEREYWFQQFRRNQPAGMDEATLQSEFEKHAPPGFFGHRRAFRSDGSYGKWLLEKPLMIVINGTVFVHGGAPPYVAEHGLAGVNRTLKMDLLNFVNAKSALEDASVLSPIDRFRKQSVLLTTAMENGQIDDTLVPMAHAIVELEKSPLHGPAGPLWYRGTAECNRLLEGDGLNAVLSKVGATQIVFGHTPTSTRRVQQRMDGQVLEIDTGMLKANYKGSGNALVIDQGLVTVTNQDGSADLSPIPHPRGVGNDSELIDDDTLAGILTNGTIIDTKTVGKTWKLVQVADFAKTVFAYFKVLPEKKGFVPEVAAYKLDRILGLYMVPVTVLREIDGLQGTLQYAPQATLTEFARVTDGKGSRATCSMSKQQNAMHIFDTLIQNPTRTPFSMLYDPDSWNLILINHQRSFGTQRDRPAHLKSVSLTIGNEWRTALLKMDDEKLRKSLGDVLDKKHLAALAKRRDDLRKN